ncbi:glycine/betaine ABC transporter ATP-binding protein [Levilactobacillus zymae]|uniref:Quaternary amine transport ATP-binding protein n=1 Tax=Levilactobacillus zymae TaxID=267363 RepID=A0ABQ0WYN5_9LACO|nr:ABC transporter ATP-binding protein [Levilactobacillus zymae]QFR61629.1 betaine/proline/choline family ABC transporter ATP-binding protein [Levilactobacillus zymae]GEO72748.1 glycine/betaine ABC transporter ATP-binding protein [Levilactobacillus zymae]
MLLSMEHLRKEYPNGKIAVDDFNLEVGKGEFICFIGTSGSGKTTTMRMINRMLNQTSGTIKINDQDISKMDPVKLRRSIGYVIQNIGLMPHMTIQENIELVPKLLGWSKEKRAKQAHKMIELAQLPDEMLQRYPGELSGGQQQRIGVVRALAADQEIILMDEPFGALDPITRESLQDLVKHLQEDLGKTFIFVTHDMDEALHLATRVVIMSQGKQVQVDTPENILRHPANEFVTNLIGEERLIRAQPNILNINQIMRKNPVAISPDKTLSDTIDLMHEKRVDTLLVTDDQDKLIGYIDLDDVSRNTDTNTPVSQLMNHQVFYVQDKALIGDTVQRILKLGVKNVPVVDDDHRLVGIVTRTSLVDIVYDALRGAPATDEQPASPINADIHAAATREGGDA